MPKKAPERIGSVLRVPLSQLHPHPQNPFAVRDDSAMQELKESVSQNGVLVPAIARPRAEGGYELIAGHRRKYACEQSGQDSMPVIVLNLNDDEAVIQLVDSNIQREDILPSERAKAYKMKMDAIKRQGARTDLTSPNISAKFRSDDSVGEKDGISGDTIDKLIDSIANICIDLGLRGEYSPEEIADLVCDIEFVHLYDAIRDLAEPVYAFSTDGERPMTLKYRSRKLFDRNATLLWREPVLCADDTELASSRYLELWLLEDMSVAVVSCVQIVYGDECDYITEYREYKGEEIPFAEPVPDLLDFVDRLESLCPDEFHPDEVIIYET